MFTALRFCIVLQIGYLSLSDSQQYSFATIQLLLLAGWITDVLDGRLARSDPQNRSTWWGGQERKIDLFMIGMAHLYISRFTNWSPYLELIVGCIGLVAFLQMIKTQDGDLFFQMLYISVVCGYILIMNLIEKTLIGYIALTYYLMLVVVNWDSFKPRVLYFVTLGGSKFE